jgi:hypothetical protein
LAVHTAPDGPLQFVTIDRLIYVCGQFDENRSIGERRKSDEHDWDGNLVEAEGRNRTGVEPVAPGYAFA